MGVKGFQKGYHLYGMRLRGFSLGCCPEIGLVGWRDVDSKDPPPINAYFSILLYDRKLSDVECEEYGLAFIGL